MYNKISECLREMAVYVSDPEMDTHPDVPDELLDAADLTDRLVKAARNVLRGGYKYDPGKPYRELEGVLREIESEEQRE